MRSLTRWLERQGPSVIALLAVTGVLAVGVLDVLTGNELAFSFFYLLPVLMVAWFHSFALALLIGFFGGMAFPITQVLGGASYASAWVPGWNLAVRTATYCTVALLTSRLRRSLAHERSLSRTDDLTGVANSRYFSEVARSELTRARRNARPLTVAYLDLDDFKSVNDDYGHAAGDELLRRVAEILVGATRELDSVARLGGDEFVLLLPETGPDEAVGVLERVQAALREGIQALGYPATTSIGAVTFMRAPDSVDELLWPADQLMYAVKRADKDALRHQTLGDVG